MSAGDDDDLKLQRASAVLLQDLTKLLPRLLRKSGSPTVRKHVKVMILYKIAGLIEPFQEDPQLLDTHLKAFLPPLIDAYLESIQSRTEVDVPQGFVVLSNGIGYLLNLFCKVRGEKVVKGFLNNEPRYLEPVLRQLELTEDASEGAHHLVVPWAERYVLLLWLSHLTLAPFPLESLSALQSSAATSEALQIPLPVTLPGISHRILTMSSKSLQSASKERNAAAKLLVTLCIRPDMQKLGLLDVLVKWATSFFANVPDDHAGIHRCHGVLTFLSGLVASTTHEETGRYLSSIYAVCQRILDDESLGFIRSSAVARKLVVKTLRSIALQCLQPELKTVWFDIYTVLDEIIGQFLEVLADGDTPVRYAASKALSAVTLKLDLEMAEDVVEAVFGSLNENVYWSGNKRNVGGVNPLRWHGLTLTLSHLLYKKAISTNQLPDVLNALILSLGFEQRSPTGGSIGANVRDAACFGIWALSRRYTTEELRAVSTSTIRASEHREELSVPQILAIELVTVACLDPAGNIRRGSSAALQELIGRHPNTIEEGIPLVQTVDFHAVGLRQRALCEVAIQAGRLHSMYWETLLENLQDWKGVGALDSESRSFAARAIGFMANDQPLEKVQAMMNTLCSQLKLLKPREVEERQGLVLSLAALARTVASMETSGSEDFSVSLLWRLFEEELKLEDRAFTSPAQRPELTASSICSLIGALSNLTMAIHVDREHSDIPYDKVVHYLNLCLLRSEEIVLAEIPDTVTSFLRILLLTSSNKSEEITAEWLSKLEHEASYNGLRCAGFTLALGAAYSVISTPGVRSRILRVLTLRCTPAVAIEARTIALRALRILMASVYTKPDSTDNLLPLSESTQVHQAIHSALNDYTITERGDVGSLVRLQALDTILLGWSDSQLADLFASNKEISADIIRLSLEKLDKIRVRASHLLRLIDPQLPDDVSSYAYFSYALHTLPTLTSPTTQSQLILGYTSAAGTASESVLQHARAALCDFLDGLADSTDTDGGATFTLLDFATHLLELLRAQLTTDRTLLPILETTAYLLDMHILQRLASTSFKFRTLLSLTQKSHYQSTHPPKLLAALSVYRGLADVAATRRDTLSKLAGMLGHPFPVVRSAAAETLWVVARVERVRSVEWGGEVKGLRGVVEEVRGLVGGLA